MPAVALPPRPVLFPFAGAPVYRCIIPVWVGAGNSSALLSAALGDSVIMPEALEAVVERDIPRDGLEARLQNQLLHAKRHKQEWDHRRDIHRAAGRPPQP